MKPVKQVLVLRADVKYSQTGLATHASRASMEFLRHKMVGHRDNTTEPYIYDTDDGDFSQEEFQWFTGEQLREVLVAEDLEHLQKIHSQAIGSGLRAHMAFTYFGDQREPVCLALGPDFEELLDPVVKNVSPY